MQCNIDARGRAVRLRAGLVACLIGLALLITGLVGPEGLRVLAWIGGGLLLTGGFGVFEARAGWCAVRAMGFKTRI